MCVYIYIYIYILSGCKERSERFFYILCTNVFSTFFSQKNVERTREERRKNGTKERRKNEQINVEKTVSFSIPPPTLPPWRQICFKGGHGMVTVKNVQKTIKNIEKTLGQRNATSEAPAWRPPGCLSSAAFQYWPAKIKNVGKTNEKRRKIEREKRRKNGDKHVGQTSAQET